MAEINGSDVKAIIVACDAGMGSSVMLTSQLRRKFKKYGVSVDHSPVNEIPAGTALVLCHEGLAARARKQAPDAVVVPFQLFLGDPVFDTVERAIRDGGTLAG